MTADARPFEATIYPNPPIGRRGVAGLLLCLSTVSLVMSVGFVLAGAWPVAGFMGLDVALLFVAFREIRRRARCSEHIRLDRSGLHVRRVFADGSARAWRFEPYCVQVRMDDPPRRDSLLTLASHGSSLRLGSFLTVTERVALARALRSALKDYR